MLIQKTCIICSNRFWFNDSPSRKNRGKTCSRKCYYAFRKGKPAWNKGLPAPWSIGNQYRKGKPNDFFRKNKKIGSKNPKWKGDRVGYRGLHYWVERQLGKPKKCSHCKTEKSRFHWANISGKYLRNITDWIRLCAKCHKKYDSVHV